MPKELSDYWVEVEFVIHVRAKVLARDALNKDIAIETVQGLIPSYVAQGNMGWKASVDLRPPRGVAMLDTVLKAQNISSASGGEKAVKVKK